MDTRAKVLLATYSAVPSPDRQGVLVENMILALSARYELDVLSLKAGELPYVSRLHGARMLRVPIPDGSAREQVDAFRRAVRRQLEGADYDIVHVRSGWAALPLCETGGLHNTRVVLDLTLSCLAEAPAADLDFHERSVAEERQCLERADLVVVPDEHARRFLLGLGVRVPVRVVPPGVNVDLFDWEPPPPGTGPFVAYVGRVAPNRGLRTLLSAFRRVASENPARLLLVGPFAPGFQEVLEDSVARLGLADRVVTTGPVAHQDVPRLLAASRVCVLPAAVKRGEPPLAGMPLALLEYLACARPAVVAKGRFSETLETHGPCLVTLEREDADSLAEAIVSSLSTPDEERTARGYRLVRDSWTASGSRRALLAIYRQMAPYGPPAKALVATPIGQTVPAPHQTTTARRFAAMHDTIVQTGSAPMADGYGGQTEGTARTTDAAEVLDVTDVAEIIEDSGQTTGRFPRGLSD